MRTRARLSVLSVTGEADAAGATGVADGNQRLSAGPAPCMPPGTPPGTPASAEPPTGASR